MKIRSAVIGLILFVCTAGLGYVGLTRLVLPRRGCDLCGRPIHATHQAILHLKDGTHYDTCCPRCAMHFAVQKPGEVARLDAASGGNTIDGQKAVYLEGSSIDGCQGPAEFVPRDPGVQYDLHFDRCLPTLIAFKNTQEALAFQQRFGGRVLSYEDALASVKRH